MSNKWGDFNAKGVPSRRSAPELKKLVAETQYRYKQYRQMPREKGIRQSVSRKGSCSDTAVIENFFGLLKSELLYLQEFSSMERFRQELSE